MKKAYKHIIFYAVLVTVWVVVAKLKIWPPYVFPAPWGVCGSAWWPVSRPQLLDRHRRQHEAHAARLWHLGGAGHGPRIGDGQQQVPGRNHGRPAGQPAEPAQHLLAAAGGAVVWTYGKSHPVRRRDGIAACRSPSPWKMAADRFPRSIAWPAAIWERSGFRLFWHVLLPASLPYIISGLKQGWAFAWRSLISGEMIFVSLARVSDSCS